MSTTKEKVAKQATDNSQQDSIISSIVINGDMSVTTLNLPTKYDADYFSKRFQPQHHYAAATLGAPINTVQVDRAVFHKSIPEREVVAGFKKDMGKTKHHKFKTVLKVCQ